jgi:phosphoserine phosphatase RsbU/P
MALDSEPPPGGSAPGAAPPDATLGGTGPTDQFYAALCEDDPEDLYEHAPCGYLSTLADGTIVKVNQTLLTWIGHRRDELVGRKRFVDLLTVGGRIYHETHYAPLLRMQGSVREIAVEIVRADGHRLPVLVNSVLRRGRDQAPAMIRTAVFDATERRSYEQELLRARTDAEEAGARARLLARTLQESLIPPNLPEVPGADVAAVYRPAGRGDEVGGDFYDVFETADGGWAVVIGDVCGKGAEAATVTALARYTIRAAAMRGARPHQVLTMLNEALLRQETDRFCTVAYLRLQTGGTGVRLTAGSAGHPPPLLLGVDGSVHPVGSSGHLLGVFPDVWIPDTTIDLTPGETIVLYTDGITEARVGGGFLGDEGLRELLAGCAGLDAHETTSRIADAAVGLQAGTTSDDIAVVAVRAPLPRAEPR